MCRGSWLWLSSLDNSHPHGPVPADPQYNEATKVQQREGFEVPLPLFFLRFWPVLRFSTVFVQKRARGKDRNTNTLKKILKSIVEYNTKLTKTQWKI